MTPQEIRIGNYIFSKETQEPQKITGIDLESPYIDAITFDYLEYQDIEPISLTEEWLAKLPKKFTYPKWIKYVHTLQNWYWIQNNCNKELKI